MSSQNIDLTWHILKSRNMSMTEAVPRGEWWIVLALSIFCPFPCQHLWLTEWAAGDVEVCKCVCVCPCMLFMCKCLMLFNVTLVAALLLTVIRWLYICASEWFVYSLSKDQFPLCVYIAVYGYLQGRNCPSEHLREHLNALFTQH